MKATLRPYQMPHLVKLVQAMLTHNVAHDGSDTGAGKMYVGAALTKALDEETLIVAPLSVLPSWQRTLDAFGCCRCTLVNYEKAWRHLGEIRPHGAGSYFRWSRNWQNIVFDESHRCGGGTTVNSKMMIAAKRQAGRVATLSATVATKPQEMKAFGFVFGLHSLSDFRDFLFHCKCKPGHFGGWTFDAAKNHAVLVSLQDAIYNQGKGSRMRIEDIPGFPKTFIDVITIACVDKQAARLSAKALEHYNERAVAAHQAESALAEMIFMRQALEVAKVPALIDLTTDALETSRVAIFYNFDRTAAELTEAATKRKWTFAVIQGGQSAAARQTIVASYQANEYDVIFVNIQAGGVGVSLHDPVTQVPRTAFICPTFSAKDLKQTLGRVHRLDGGFSRQFLVYFSDSLEGAIARVVKTKLDSLDLINDAELSGDFRIAA